MDYWNSLLKSLDYMMGYEMLKIGRTIVLSTCLMGVILLVRKAMDFYSKKKHVAAGLYVKAYLWLIFLPVPFMGTLKLSYEHFRLRNLLYVKMYGIFIGHTMIAKLYFLGMTVVAAVLLIRKARLRSWVRRLPLCEKERLGSFGKQQMSGVRIRVTELSITPFTTGIFKRNIVLPEYLFREFDETEIDAVLQHEYCHIRRGHLLVYALLDLFRVLWYINPLVHVCARQVKDDLEMICDHAVIWGNAYNPEGYGMTLLKSMMCLQPGSHKGVPALIRETSFAVMKKRIQSIAAYREYPNGYLKRIYIFSAVMLLLICSLGKIASYPVYTPFDDYALYSMDGRQRIFGDSETFNSAVQKRDTGLLVDNRKVKHMLRDAEINNDEGAYWIYYGGYMKMPGIGGGGDLIYYNAADAAEDEILLPYNEPDRFSQMIDWMLRHM